MNVDSDALNEIFRMQDFLGLIAMGVPDNEYEEQVEEVLAALESLPREEATESRLVAIFEDVYRSRFNWPDEQMQRVRPDFAEIASKVVKYFG
jgi:hypothetical protein